MTFQIITGNLFDDLSQYDALAQGVNCQGLMGAGIAVPFRDTFPSMYLDYKELCETYRDVLPGLLHTFHEKETTIFNLFSQEFPGRCADYELLQKATLLMRIKAEEIAENFKGTYYVGLPWIGCGIGGLERHNVQHIFERILAPSTVTFELVQMP